MQATDEDVKLGVFARLRLVTPDIPDGEKLECTHYGALTWGRSAIVLLWCDGRWRIHRASVSKKEWPDLSNIKYDGALPELRVVDWDGLRLATREEIDRYLEPCSL